MKKPQTTSLFVGHESHQDSKYVNCRVCSSKRTLQIGIVEFYTGFEWPIWDCRDCGCRFTRHEESVYDQLHSEVDSSYARYRDQAARCKALFDRHDLAGLKSELSETSKYKFVIKQTESLGRGSRILEIGCARGFLTAYFALAGHTITGVDVSREALASARAAFGDHFVPAGSPSIPDGAPYDVIYHVGTIGCVSDPVSMTKQLLSLLKPSGRLLFNAPNRDALWFRRQLWVDAAPPPDVVTLFPPGFWRKQFAAVADVGEEVELCGSEKSLVIGLRKLFCHRWRTPVPLRMNESHKPFSPPPRTRDKLWRFFERCVAKAARVTKLSRLAPAEPTEFGLFVSMTRK